MRIDVRRLGAIPVIAPEGRITIGVSAHALKDAIDTEIQAGAHHLIVDGARVAYLDSTGLGELIAAARILSERGGRIGIAAPSAKLREILDITGLTALFAVGDDATVVAEALGGPGFVETPGRPG